jgi:tetratricopeptide (TPR) repeat protein
MAKPSEHTPIGPAAAEIPTHGDNRLNSWKEIAPYLGRDVRTVQRWERLQGLPVHRHQHNRLSTAYALKSELDAWWHTRPADHADSVPPAAEPVEGRAPGEPLAATSVGRRRATAVVGIVVAGMVLLGWSLWPSATDPSGSLTFGGEDWVLVTALENTTGNSVFDGTVEYLLRQAMAESPLVRVASPDRVRDALALMRQPSDTRIDLGVAREVSLRDGAIRALVVPRLDRVATRLRLSADIVTPSDGLIVATNARVVDTDAAVIEAVSAQASWIRRTLGERLPTLPSTPPYQRATTASLTALQMYSKAYDLGLQSEWAPAAKLLETAIARDPDFASAHILLAWALVNVGGQDAAILDAAERARQLAAGSSEGERFFIEGSYLNIRGSLPGADDAYARFAEATTAFEALRQIEPHHYWGSLNLQGLYRTLQRFDAAASLAVEMVAVRPNDFRTRVRAAHALLSRGDVEAAAPHMARADELARVGSVTMFPQERSWIDLFDAHRAWLAGDLEGARQVVDRVAAALDSQPPSACAEYAHRVGGFYLSLGRCRDARAALAHARPDFRHEALAAQAMSCDDQDAFRVHLVADARESSDPSFWRVMYGARTGDLRQARQWVESFRRLHQNRITLAVADGELAAAAGDWKGAVRHFERAWDYLRYLGQERTCIVAVTLADAYRRTGRPDLALAILEATTPMRPRVFDVQGLHGGMTWIRAQAALADFYRELGRVSDAARIEDSIGPLLRLADPDLPLLERLGRAH